MLTQKRLKEVVKYAPETGVFTWKTCLSNSVRLGAVSGYINNRGYRIIAVDSKNYPAHRLAFLFMAGYLPEHEVDHMDGDKDNNAWVNLREVSHSCNLQNQKTHSNNKSGFRGVCWSKSSRKWSSYIKVHGKILSLGVYDDKLEAALARITCEDNCPSWTCDIRCENRIKVMAAVFPGS